MAGKQEPGVSAGAPSSRAPGEEVLTVEAVAERFAGFPAGRLAFTPVPDLLFSELLPAIDDAAELKVTLHVMWLLQRHAGAERVVSLAELAGDGLLRRGLLALGLDADAALLRGLDRAVTRGTLLRVSTVAGGGEPAVGVWYVLNSAKGREYLARLRTEQVALPDGSPYVEERPVPRRPTVFALYEQNMGPLQPLIAEELEEAQRLYPADWLEDAFRIAAENNARNWRYVRAVLERWRRQGRDSDESGGRHNRKRYITGEYEEYRRG
ncbi:MAG: DnaD domain-containing protein [Anaerolineae bacterium]